MTTLTSLIDARRRAGYGADFAIAEDAHLRCSECGHCAAAATIDVDALDRVEGQSDPSDQSAVVSLTCPACGSRGTVIVRYGPEASAAEAELLRTL